MVVAKVTAPLYNTVEETVKLEKEFFRQLFTSARLDRVALVGFQNHFSCLTSRPNCARLMPEQASVTVSFAGNQWLLPAEHTGQGELGEPG